MNADTTAVLLAAGSGQRLGAGRNKALLPLAQEPLVLHPLRALLASPSVGSIVLVMPAEDAALLEAAAGCTLADLGISERVDGGSERWLSSRSGCEAAPAASDLLLVHDAARALLPVETVEAVLAAARLHGAALAAEPVTDTLKRGEDGRAVATTDRRGLWRAQTPQAANRELLLGAFDAWSQSAPPTDEASLLEAAGTSPVLVEGPRTNIKITWPTDLELAEAWLMREARTR